VSRERPANLGSWRWRKGYSIRRLLLRRIGLVLAKDVQEAVRRTEAEGMHITSVLYHLDWMRDGR
jgi:hypothetical protein